ncbi:hypothetical protein C7S16_5567 [Burkholderia thailandensis]|uniref:Uncharacterized protein n=1 Tax=Burkholderia thailandensis TaxID=57975 RepID=A0AAW9CPF8_BURTH|nr:hypothetical protein [Burkholderia thailandensis]
MRRTARATGTTSAARRIEADRKPDGDPSQGARAGTQRRTRIPRPF